MYFNTNWYKSPATSLATRLIRPQTQTNSNLQLHNGSRIAVIGGGPAGSLFAFFLLKLAKRLDLELNVQIFEPRYFGNFGPAGCNHCGGIVSESLVQILAIEGINLPPEVVQRGIDTYVLHTDVGDVSIESISHEKRIAAVYRGGGPRNLKQSNWRSFDQYLLELAQQQGASLQRELVIDIKWQNGLPCIVTNTKINEHHDLVVIASGVNSKLIEQLDAQNLGYKRPITTNTFISEFHIGEENVQKYLGSAMHVFLLDLPRLKFAALIPKRQFVTLCLVGKEIDIELVRAFLNSKEVKNCLPTIPNVENIAACHCLPRISIVGSPQPFADRLLFVGDSGVTRLYKDGIGAAYRTAKTAANATILGGVAANDFKQHFMPACQRIITDNNIGKLVFFASDILQGMKFGRRIIIRMTQAEQQSALDNKYLSGILWDIFTGSAPYREILLNAMNPHFIMRLCWNVLLTLNPFKNT